jgi:hypothetical protein
MPRKTIRLGLSNPFTPEPGARFLSFLAYPNPENGGMAAAFFLAICRFAIMAMWERDRAWANSPQAIKPGIILMGDTVRRKALRSVRHNSAIGSKLPPFSQYPTSLHNFKDAS